MGKERLLGGKGVRHQNLAVAKHGVTGLQSAFFRIGKAKLKIDRGLALTFLQHINRFHLAVYRSGFPGEHPFNRMIAAVVAGRGTPKVRRKWRNDEFFSLELEGIQRPRFTVEVNTEILAGKA